MTCSPPPSFFSSWLLVTHLSLLLLQKIHTTKPWPLESKTYSGNNIRNSLKLNSRKNSLNWFSQCSNLIQMRDQIWKQFWILHGAKEIRHLVTMSKRNWNKDTKKSKAPLKKRKKKKIATRTNELKPSKQTEEAVENNLKTKINKRKLIKFFLLQWKSFSKMMVLMMTLSHWMLFLHSTQTLLRKTLLST